MKCESVRLWFIFKAKQSLRLYIGLLRTQTDTHKLSKGITGFINGVIGDYQGSDRPPPITDQPAITLPIIH